MYSIKFFQNEIDKIASDRQKWERGYKGNARFWAKNMAEYCHYLEDVLSTFKIVVVELELSRYEQILKVDYLTGESKRWLDPHSWDTALLAAVEQIVNSTGRTMRYNYVSDSEAA